MSVHVGIDADIIVYSCGFAAEEEPVSHALNTVKQMINRIITNTEADTHTLYLTGKGNYRKEIATIAEYKGNRKDTPKPRHFEAIREYILKRKEAQLIEGMEADDALGIAAFNQPADTQYVLASIDKDLDMIPCLHYNWRKDEMYEVGEAEALRFFYTQLLTGDSTDNIAGLYKLTGQKALKTIKEPLEEMNEASDMYSYVRSVYYDSYIRSGILPDCVDVTIDKWLLEIGRLLWIKREEGEELWQPPEVTFKDEENIDG